MRSSWAKGARAAIAAMALMGAASSLAQDAAAPADVPVASPAVTDAVAPPQPAELAARAAAVAEAAGAHSTTQMAATTEGYVRMAPTPGIGQPVPGGIALQQPVTPIGQEAHRMMNAFLNPVIFAISIFVLALMGWTIWRYRAAANPEPSKTTHNLKLEVIWTAVPALILLVIAVPSFRLLANQYDPPKADITIKVTGYQWYWGYEYPDYGGISFDSVMLGEKEAKAEGVPYQLDVDNRLVVPAGKTVKVLITAADVLHSWAVPSFWVKMDAVPGRINETWFKVDRPGVYYGQCSELCGTKHGFMPITVEVLPEEEFKAWVRMRQRADGIEPTGPGIVDDRMPISPAAAAAAMMPATTASAAPDAAPAA